MDLKKDDEMYCFVCEKKNTRQIRENKENKREDTKYFKSIKQHYYP